MSLILEALRKSERERRLGAAPDLHSPMPTAGRDRDRRRAWLPWVLVAVAAAALAALLVARDPAPPVPPPAAGTGFEAAATAPRSDGPPPPAIPMPPATTNATQARAPSPAPVATPARQPAGRPVPEASAALPRAELPPRIEPTAGREERPVAIAGTHAEAAVVVPPAAPADPGDSGAEDMPSLQSLPAATRAALPPLQVSMHVYADDPAGRFAVIDGRRTDEGDAITPVLRLVEIRRDGSVLEYQGRRFLLPRP
ncbi:general secretion pathway protein GspB [Coralloluteibacterium stylophorae]|uniref:General secretion pathway protein GspB n=1 Tax=Coralloluteibacterium stylophorae TaxID=1776034 RepID=A0AAP2G152_9GAMM|nr:general secretion pathway protein GspB [Coralloluteibacterium stylophorae]MBS7458070.1 general secretion pathway protein GspB [Coralloluteibacterium stylophorae]